MNMMTSMERKEKKRNTMEKRGKKKKAVRRNHKTRLWMFPDSRWNR